MKTGCPGCGANVEFKPELQKFHCDHCGADSDISAFNEVELEADATKVDYDECTCSSCGAKLIVGKDTTITVCVYCGSNQIMTNRFTGDFKPDSIIPFQISQEKFINMYHQFVKKRILAPDEFRKNTVISEIKGLYVPFYQYVLDGKTSARGEGLYSTKDSTSYLYFDTAFEARFVSLQDASKKLNDNVMTSLEPYDLVNVNSFHPAYLNGFSSENGDEQLEALEKKARTRCANESVKILNKRLGRYSFNKRKNGSWFSMRF